MRLFTLNILLGYEVGSGKPIKIPFGHSVVTGMTQLTGKTTTLEALVSRGNITAITFLTKRGESGFRNQRLIKPYYQETKVAGKIIDWQYVESILEAVMGEKMNILRSYIINACNGRGNMKPAYTLEEVYENIKLGREESTRGFDEAMFTNLSAYFEIILPEIRKRDFADSIKLKKGFNVMDLIDLPEQMQQLVIRATMAYVYENCKNVVTIIPEAHKFIPPSNTPVKPLALKLIREGAAIGNYVWIDSMPSYEVILCRVNGEIQTHTFESLFHLSHEEKTITEREEEIGTPAFKIDVPSTDGSRLLWKPLISMIRHDYSGEILSINTLDGLIDVSPNHPVMRIPCYLTPASDLKEGYRICTRRFRSDLKNGGTKGRIPFVGVLDLAWFYGFYSAEGWVNGNHTLLVSEDESKIKRASKIIQENFYVLPTIYKRDKCYILDSGSSVLTRHIMKTCYLLNCEEYSSYTKQVPFKILNAHQKVKNAFFEGYADGDGGKDRGYVRTATSNSRALLLGLDYIKRIPYSLHIRDDKDAIQFIYNKTDERRKTRDEIKKIRSKHYEGWLYDLEVDSDDHTFYMGLGNIRVHNTQETTSVDKQLLKQVSIWVMGYQQEKNEVKNIREHLGKKVKASQITSLKLGHFLALIHQEIYHVYVLPNGVKAGIGRKVARGEIPPEHVRDTIMITKGDDEEVYRRKAEELEEKLTEAKDRIKELEGKDAVDLSLDLEKEKTLRKEGDKEITRLGNLMDQKDKDHEDTVMDLKNELVEVKAEHLSTNRFVTAFKDLIVETVTPLFPPSKDNAMTALSQPIQPEYEGVEVSFEQPAIEVVRKIPKLIVDTKSTRGQIFYLYATGALEAPDEVTNKAISTAAVNRLLISHGWNKSPRTKSYLDDMMKAGYLEPKQAGKRYDYIVKIPITEAKERGLVTFREEVVP